MFKLLKITVLMLLISSIGGAVMTVVAPFIAAATVALPVTAEILIQPIMAIIDLFSNKE